MNNIKADHAWKNYFKVPCRAKDFINVLLYQGNNEKLSLSLQDSEETTIIDKDHPHSLERRRDIVYMIENQEKLCIIGIENQKQEDKSMVIRNLIYDGMDYLNQYERGEEIKQVITVVLNFSENEWTAPIQLKEYITHMSNEELFNNWKIPVYNVKDLDENLFKEKDNRDLIKGIKMFYKFKGHKEEIEDFTLKVSRDVAIVVASVTGCQELEEIIKKMKGETIDMCTGFRIYTEIIQKESELIGYNNGKHDGIDIGYNKGKNDGIEEAFDNLIKYGTDVYKAIDMLKIPLQNQQYYINKYS